MTQLSDQEGSVLAAIARAAVREALGAAASPLPAGGVFDRPGATFVTLYRGETLHGCIGSLEPRARLAEDVAHNAVAAALRDPRATALSLSDVELLGIEVSVLSPMERIPCASESEAIASLRPHHDGVLLRYGRHQGTFLPQVWKSLPDPLEFLSELRQKARLPASFWSPELEVYRYSVQKFAEHPRSQARIT